MAHSERSGSGFHNDDRTADNEHPLGRGKSANGLHPVRTYMNHLIMTHKGKTVLLSGQRSFDGSRLIRGAGLDENRVDRVRLLGLVTATRS